MTRIFCDVCGTEIDIDKPGIVSRELAELAGIADVCPKCAEAAEEIDLQALVLTHWRGKAITKSRKARQEKQDKPAKPAPKKYAAQEAAEVDGIPAQPVPPMDDRPAPQQEPGDGEKPADQSSAAAQETGQEERARRWTTVGRQPAGKPGAHWSEKRETAERLRTYRQDNGLGSLSDVARIADVSVETVRGMLEASPYPIDTWRKVAGALDKLSGKPEGGDAQEGQ